MWLTHLSPCIWSLKTSPPVQYSVIKCNPRKKSLDNMGKHHLNGWHGKAKFLDDMGIFGRMMWERKVWMIWESILQNFCHGPTIWNRLIWGCNNVLWWDTSSPSIGENFNQLWVLCALEVLDIPLCRPTFENLYFVLGGFSLSFLDHSFSTCIHCSG